MHSSTRLMAWARLARSLAPRPATSAAWLVAGLVAGVGCTSGDDQVPAHAVDAGLASEPADLGNGVLQLQYNPVFSAFVEGHEARLPMVLKDLSLRGKGAKFRSSNPEIAVVQETADGAIVTVKRDGVCVIRAEIDGDTANVKLTIKKFSETQWQAGQARYAKSELAIVPPDGGAINLLAFADPSARNPNGACNTCHGADAKTLKFEATPTQVAGYSDDQLSDVFTKGQKPEGWVQKTEIPAVAWAMFHQWTVTEEEKQGLIAYLRTLPLKSNVTGVGIGLRPCPPAADAATARDLCNPGGKPLPTSIGSGGMDAAAPTPMIGEAGAEAASDAGTLGDGG